MTTHKGNPQSGLDPEAIAQDSADQERDQEGQSKAIADALASPSASGSGTIKVNG